MSQAIRTEDLRKSLGKTTALGGVNLEVPAGIVYGLLGPNGAGKTTIVRILATLIRPDAGRAFVAGHDVVREGEAVRRLIGLTGQFAALDEALTANENLVLIGRLSGLSSREARSRAGGLLETVGLSDVAGRSVRTYSGGMRRRVDLAASLVARPQVLFLDEPSTGLDPASRLALWDLVARTVHEGTTVLLTSQYLEEVDRLASRIAVLNHGLVVAEGTPAALKSRVGGHVVAVRVDAALVERAAGALAPLGKVQVEVDEIAVPTRGQAGLGEALRRLDSAGIAINEIALRTPTLDEVFLSLMNGGNHDEEAA